MGRAYQFGNSGPFWHGRSMLNGPMDVGNVYYVILKSKAFYDEYMKRQGRYRDGSNMIYPDDGDGLGIAAAIAVCKGGRNDYVIVGTGAYNLTAALTLAGKSSVHLLGTNGGTYDVGCAQGTVLIQTGNFQNVIMEVGGELSGFHIINKTGYQAVTAAITVYGGSIHHNNFRIVGGAAIDLVSCLLWSGGNINSNRFYTYTGGVLNSVIYVGEGTGVDVCNNRITASAQAVYTYGIYCDAVSGLVADNYLGESGGAAAGAYGGTITHGISVPYHGNVMNNRITVGTGQGLNGGTADHSFSDNRDGQAGGAAAIIT